MTRSQALAALLEGIVSPHILDRHWWGCVVTDKRFPALWDANCAIIEADGLDQPSLAEIETELLPAMRLAGVTKEHLVLVFPKAADALLQELTGRGDRIGWDICMSFDRSKVGTLPASDSLDFSIETVTDFGEEFRTSQRRAFAEFAVKGAAADQLEVVERELVESGQKRWVTVRIAGQMVAFGAVQFIEPSFAYVDNILTFPEARGRGIASAIVAHLLREISPERDVFLLAEAGRGPAALYERLGFIEEARIASSLRTVK